MATTPKGFTSPAINVDNANQDAIKALADRMDAILSARTAAAIDALTGTDLWTGRIQRQTNGTGSANRQQSGLYHHDGTAWKALVGDGLGGTATGPTLTAETTNPNMGSGTNVAAWDWWMLGQWLIGSIVFVWGTGSPTGGSGEYIVSLPRIPTTWSGLASNSLQPIGSGIITAVSVPTSRDVIPLWDPATGALCQLVADNSTTFVSNGTPLTLGAAGDQIKLNLMYPTLAS